jgi:hypothetical protein
MKRKFKTFDEFGHERELKSIDRVAGKVVVLSREHAQYQ